MIVDMISNKKLNQIKTELFITGRKQNISTVFFTQSYFAVPKDVMLNCTNKRELQQTAFNHSLGVNFEDFMNLYKKCTAKHTLF